MGKCRSSYPDHVWASPLLSVHAVFQALDVWAMGITLYCFVYGKVSCCSPALHCLPAFGLIPFQIKANIRDKGLPSVSSNPPLQSEGLMLCSVERIISSPEPWMWSHCLCYKPRAAPAVCEGLSTLPAFRNEPEPGERHRVGPKLLQHFWNQMTKSSVCQS